MFVYKSFKIGLFCLFLFLHRFSFGQSVDVEISSDPNIELSFNTVAKLTNGIVIPNAITVNITAVGTTWDLYAGAVTSVAGTWDNAQYYSSGGNGTIPVNILSMRAHNLSNTTVSSGYIPMQDIASSTMDIIGNHFAPDPLVNCSDLNHVGTNATGSYLNDPQCYQFRIDLKATPGIFYRPGVYTMQIVFIIAQDL